MLTLNPIVVVVIEAIPDVEDLNGLDLLLDCRLLLDGPSRQLTLDF